MDTAGNDNNGDNGNTGNNNNTTNNNIDVDIDNTEGVLRVLQQYEFELISLHHTALEGSNSRGSSGSSSYCGIGKHTSYCNDLYEYKGSVRGRERGREMHYNGGDSGDYIRQMPRVHFATNNTTTDNNNTQDEGDIQQEGKKRLSIISSDPLHQEVEERYIELLKQLKINSSTCFPDQDLFSPC